MLELVLIVLISLEIVLIVMRTRMGPWAVFLAVIAAAGLYLLIQVQTSSR
jgi:hypothetical protein